MSIESGLTDLWLILPFVIIFIGSITPITVKVLRRNREPAIGATLFQGIAAVLFALCAVVVQWDNSLGYAFSQALVLDGVSSWANFLTLLITGWSLILMHDNLHTRDHQFSEQVSLVLSSALGMMIIAWSNDLIVTFIGIELMSLCLYVVIGLGLEQRLSKESALKYFVLGSFGSAVLLYGIALIFGTAESTQLTKIVDVAPTLIATNKVFLIGTIMVIVGICFKVSIFPFHAWTPDVYQGAPTPITAFMATGVKVVVFVLFARLALTGIFSQSEVLVDVLEWLAVLTILAGNLGAFRQSNFKRMLAYSSVAHSGYILVGIIAVSISNNPEEALSSVIFYLLNYTVMTLGAFGLASLYEKTENAALLVEDLKGLASRRPGLAFGMTVLLMSIAGIPPLAGFFAKLYLFSSAVSEGMFWPVVWAVLGSVVGVVYYLRPVVYMYMYEPQQYFDEPLKYSATRAAMALSVAVVIVLGFISSPVLNEVHESLAALFK